MYVDFDICSNLEVQCKFKEVEKGGKGEEGRRGKGTGRGGDGRGSLEDLLTTRISE